MARRQPDAWLRLRGTTNPPPLHRSLRHFRLVIATSLSGCDEGNGHQAQQAWQVQQTQRGFHLRFGAFMSSPSLHDCQLRLTAWPPPGRPGPLPSLKAKMLPLAAGLAGTWLLVFEWQSPAHSSCRHCQLLLQAHVPSSSESSNRALMARHPAARKPPGRQQLIQQLLLPHLTLLAWLAWPLGRVRQPCRGQSPPGKPSCQACAAAAAACSGCFGWQALPCQRLAAGVGAACRVSGACRRLLQVARDAAVRAAQPAGAGIGTAAPAVPAAPANAETAGPSVSAPILQSCCCCLLPRSPACFLAQQPAGDASQAAPPGPLPPGTLDCQQRQAAASLVGRLLGSRGGAKPGGRLHGPGWEWPL